MNVASLELCKELYELSGWEKLDGHGYICANADHQSYNRKDCNAYCDDIPGYDLGYLIRKLPNNIGDQWLRIAPLTENMWSAYYVTMGVKSTGQDEWSDTPEDAACKLAIQLFKQGLLNEEKEQ